MTETRLLIQISELSTIRVTCKCCETVTELKLDRVGTVFSKPTCNNCGQMPFGAGLNPLVDLANAVASVQRISEGMNVEFITQSGELPLKSG